MLRVDAIILASGLSKRMGQNKLLLPLGNTTLLEVFLEKFPFALFNEVLLIVSNSAVAQVASKYPLTICWNSHPEYGKSWAINLGVKQSSATDGLLFCVADQPLLKQETVNLLLKTFTATPNLIIIPRAEGLPRNPVIFPAKFKRELEKLKGDDGGKSVREKHPELQSFVEFENVLQFYDIDTPENYKKLLNLCHEIR